MLQLGLIGALVSFCGLLSSLSLKDVLLIEAGGVLGRTTFSFFESVIGGPGTILFLSLVFLLSLMLSTRFSPYQLVPYICGGWSQESLPVRSGKITARARTMGPETWWQKATVRASRETRPVMDIPLQSPASCADGQGAAKAYRGFRSR